MSVCKYNEQDTWHTYIHMHERVECYLCCAQTCCLCVPNWLLNSILSQELFTQNTFLHLKMLDAGQLKPPTRGSRECNGQTHPPRACLHTKTITIEKLCKCKKCDLCEWPLRMHKSMQEVDSMAACKLLVNIFFCPYLLISIL